MRMTQTIKKFFSVVLALVMLIGMVPTTVFAATDNVVDTAVIFSDLHTKKSDYKESTLKNVMSAMKNSGLNISSVTSAGDAFSVNEDSSSSNGPYTGYTSKLTSAIQSVLGNVPVNYVWSDHDRYAVQEDGVTLLDKTSRLVYGAGNDGVYGTDDDGNYYVYSLSMGDLCSYDRYKAGFNTDNGNNRASKGFTATVQQAVANFQADAAKLKKDRPLFIASHQPLFDNRNDNAFAELWFDAINEVATGMDVAFFYGHNHKYDTGNDYYYAKGSTMPVTTTNGWNGYQTGSGYQYTKGDPKPVNKTLNFTHMCAGYLAPSSTGSTSTTTREGTLVAITIYDDAINYTTYNSSGVYTGKYALNVTVPRMVPAHTHKYTVVTVDATCSEEGSVTYTCDCGESYSEEIAALGHKYQCVTTDASCADNGTNVYTCTVCADSYSEVIPATGNHHYTSITADATCTEAGSVTYTCENCGDSYAETIAALGHRYESTVTSATCTENGYTTYTCTVCGHSYMGEEIAAFGHDYVSKVTATCTDAGFVVYTCNTCGHSYNGEAVAAYGHSYETTTVEPTCSTAGYTTYVCTSCGYTYTGNEVAALGHSYEAVVTAATCTEAGYTTYTCTACGHSYVGDNVAALGHDYDSVVTAPTYEAEGYTTHTCKVCGFVKVDSFVPMLRHTYETVTTEATCTEDGSVVHTCVDCGYSYTEVLPALGHAYETVTTEATCTADGSVVTTCTVCGETNVEVIPATGHNYETITIAPTCTEAGYTTHTCTCGYVITEEIAALGHSYSSKTVAPTCTENGGVIYTCSNCGNSYTDVIDALGHNYVTKSVVPTCTNAGYTVYTCETCGHSYNADEVAALGHSYESTVTAPTCTAGGYTTHSCTVCGHSYTDGNTAATGHSYTTTEENGKRIYTCSYCGYSYSESLAMTYTKVTSLSGDNNYVITFVSGNKYYAMSHKNNQISVVQVKVSSNKITTEITEDLVWTYDNNKLSYQSGRTTYYLYAKPSSSWWGGTPTLSISSTNSTNVSFSSSKLKMSNYYLRYSSSKISLNSRSSTANIFLEQ